MPCKVAVIGADGQLGADIKKVFSRDPFYDLFPLTHEDIEITDKELTKRVLSDIKPNMVINTAAYHIVDEVESEEQRAFLINAVAQKWLAQLCQKNNWKLTFISTDYVFGLEKRRKRPYRETDRPGPINAYGVSKLAGEYLTQAYCVKHFIIRTSGLFGTAGSRDKQKKENFVDLMVRLAKERGEVKVVNDQVLSPTYTLNLAENLAELLKTDYYGLYHMTSEGSCSWWEFARKIFSFLGMKVRCEKVKSGYFKEAARRPSYSVLENYQLKKLGLNRMKRWDRNLKDYLQERGYLR